MPETLLNYAWSLPCGVSFTENVDVEDGRIASDSFEKRLNMMVRDARIDGGLLARQRRADLAGTEPGFLAGHRK
ncbi:MAG: hypothetical protein ABSA69_08345 [Verrucomicrobiota bacterium]|jgi:hypothetical protein